MYRRRMTCERMKRTMLRLRWLLLSGFLLSLFSLYSFPFSLLRNENDDVIVTFNFERRHQAGNGSATTRRERLDISPPITTSSECSFISRPTPGVVRNDLWRVMLNNDQNCEVAVFGAYYDDREVLKPSPVIQVLGVSTCQSSDANLVFCQIWFPDLHQPIVSKATIENTGRGLTVNRLKYSERLYSCPIGSGLAIPYMVSLTFQNCQNASSYIEIYRPSKELKFDIGICVVVSYGSLHPLKLIEWVEFQKLLGVKEINFYNSRLDEKTLSVLKFYESADVIKVRQSSPPILNNWCRWCQKLSAIATLNDCMYRNMYRYRYLMVIDVDEFIIPRLDSNYTELLRRLTILRGRVSPEPPASFLFRNAYFFLDIPSTGGQESRESQRSGLVTTARPSTAQLELVTSRYLQRINISAAGEASKSIVDPRRCVIMQNHYCMIRTPDARFRYTSVVNPLLALSHHYKYCHMSSLNCTQVLSGGSVVDDASRRFRGRLVANVGNTLKKMKAENISIATLYYKR